MDCQQQSITKFKVAVLGDSGVGKTTLVGIFLALKNGRVENFEEALVIAKKRTGKRDI